MLLPSLQNLQVFSVLVDAFGICFAAFEVLPPCPQDLQVFTVIPGKFSSLSYGSSASAFCRLHSSIFNSHGYSATAMVLPPKYGSSASVIVLRTIYGPDGTYVTIRT